MRFFAKSRARRAARVTYWHLDRELNRLHQMLAKTDDPDFRALLLWNLACEQQRQAEVHDKAFGVDILEDDEAGDMAQSMRWSACLYRLLSDAEKAVAYPKRGRRERMAAILGEPSDDILDEMAATPDLDERMSLLDDLYGSVVDKVGGQAAEVLACLPYPKTESVR